MSAQRDQSFGYENLSIIDKFGVYLSTLKIKKYIPKTKTCKILDLGCGFNATLITNLHKEIKTGIGIDILVNKEIMIPNIKLVESSIEGAYEMLQGEKFDIISMISVLEHLENPLYNLRKCFELLESRGLLLVNVPTWLGKYFLEFSAFKLGLSPSCEMNDHKMYYNISDLWPLLIKAGFLPINLKLNYHKFGLNLFAVAKKE